MMKRVLPFIFSRLLRTGFLLSFFIGACNARTITPFPEQSVTDVPPSPLPATSTPAPDYAAKLRNAEYQLGAAVSSRLVQLTDGKFEQGTGADYVSVAMTDFTARGDLNGDGQDEYVVLIAENYGGSGTFVFVTVYADAGGTAKYLISRLVDDRPKLNELSIRDGVIFLNAVIHKMDDRMCCPTLRTTRHYRLNDLGSLIMTDYITFTPDDKPRTITIDSPTDNVEVFHSVEIKGSVTITPFENSLTYRILDAGGVELSIGSITVNAPTLGGPGTFDQVITLGNILSGAAIRVEVQDLSAADGSLVGMDSVELVVK